MKIRTVKCKKKFNKNAGITLVALVVTIVVMIILAGITLIYTAGDNSVVQTAKESKFKQEVSSIKEKFDLARLSNNIKVNVALESEKIGRINRAMEQSNIAITKVQTLEGKLAKIHTMLQEMNEVVVKATNDSNITEVDRVAMQEEIDQLIAEINRIAKEMGELKLVCYYGVEGEILEISIESCDSNHLGENNTPLIVNITTSKSAQKSIEAVNKAINKVGTQRILLGANNNALEHVEIYLEGMKGVLESKIANEETKNNRLAFVGIDEIHSCLNRIEELTIRAMNGIYQEKDRKNLGMEIDALLRETDRIAKNTKNKDNVVLLNGEWKQKFNVTNQQLGIEKLNISTVEEATTSKSKVSQAIEQITQLEEEIDEEYSYQEFEFDIPENWKDKLAIIDGELTYIGTSQKEKTWAIDIGIETK